MDGFQIHHLFRCEHLNHYQKIRMWIMQKAALTWYNICFSLRFTSSVDYCNITQLAKLLLKLDAFIVTYTSAHQSNNIRNVIYYFGNTKVALILTQTKYLAITWKWKRTKIFRPFFHWQFNLMPMLTIAYQLSITRKVHNQNGCLSHFKKKSSNKTQSNKKHSIN